MVKKLKLMSRAKTPVFVPMTIGCASPSPSLFLQRKTELDLSADPGIGRGRKYTVVYFAHEDDQNLPPYLLYDLTVLLFLVAPRPRKWPLAIF